MSCCMESLEHRWLLSTLTLVERPRINFVTPVYLIGPVGQQWQVLTSKGTLLVRGDDADNSISVIRDGNLIKLTTQGSAAAAWRTPLYARANSVKRVVVEGMGGNDRIFVDPELLKPTTVVGGGGNDIIDAFHGATLIGGGGNDRLFARPPATLELSVGGDAITGTFQSLPYGNSLLSGGAGNDTLIGSQDDSLVGGAGRDLAIANVAAKSDGPPGELEPVGKLIDEIFSEVSGIESFQFIAVT